MSSPGISLCNNRPLGYPICVYGGASFTLVGFVAVHFRPSSILTPLCGRLPGGGRCELFDSVFISSNVLFVEISFPLISRLLVRPAAFFHHLANLHWHSLDVRLVRPLPNTHLFFPHFPKVSFDCQMFPSPPTNSR